MMLPSGQQLTLGLLATIALEEVFIITCESAPITSVVSKLQCLQSGKQRKVARGSSLASRVGGGQSVRGEEGNVSRCAVMLQQPVILSPEFGTKSSQHFHPVAIKITVKICNREDITLTGRGSL
jgi:hypothetical protein